MNQLLDKEDIEKILRTGEHSGKNLSGLACPTCGGAMEPGFIAGHWTRLRWCVQQKTKTIFAGTPLMKKRDYWNAPTLRASRCVRCKVGVFTYDN